MAKRTDLIGYCGLYCGDCAAHTQTVANLIQGIYEESFAGISLTKPLVP